MKDKWDELHYIDLFAGAGIEKIRRNFRHKLAWGSPLIAAGANYPFTRLHLVEKDSERYKALCKRTGLFPQPQPPQIIQGDANICVDEVIDNIPGGRVLNLAFLDPYGLHLDFETIRKLSRRRTDLIIFFPDHLDALRNWNIYRENPDSKLDRVLGTSQWREVFQNPRSDKWVEQLRKLYENQLRKLGYKFFEHERIHRAGKHFLYILIFCSKHDTGISLWQKVSETKPGGQRTFKW